MQDHDSVTLEDSARDARQFVRCAALYRLAAEIRALADDVDRLADAIEGVGDLPLVEDIDGAARTIVGDIDEMQRFGWVPDES